MMAPRCCSLRSAVTGFTRAARVAGINIATDATTSTSPAMIPADSPTAQPRNLGVGRAPVPSCSDQPLAAKTSA